MSDIEQVVLDEERDERGVGAHWNEDDRTVTVVLQKPLVRSDGKKFFNITLREMSISEIDRAGGRASLLQMSDRALMRILPSISTPQITETAFKNMPLSDSQSFHNAVLSFFSM